MTKLEHLAQLAREIRGVIPGTNCITIYTTGNVDIGVRTDDDVRSFAAEVEATARVVRHVDEQWIVCVAHVDGRRVTVSGPQTPIEQPAEVSL